MKTTNSNEDDCEAAVGFTPPPSCAGTYIAVETTVDTNLENAIHCATAPAQAEELVLYRSKCHIDDIPDVARGLTWLDPFYDVNDHDDNLQSGASEIIAVFDIDRTLYDRSTFDIFKWVIFIPMYVAGILLVCVLELGIAQVFFIIFFIYCFVLLIFYVMVDWRRSEAKTRISRMHIAIATRGIYIDEVDAPGSFSLACRKNIKYNEIKKCEVKSAFNYFYRTMHYWITINTTYDREIKNEQGISVGFTPSHTIAGIRNQQKFVDIVNAMIERHHTTYPTSSSSAVVESSVVEYDIDGFMNKRIN